MARETQRWIRGMDRVNVAERGTTCCEPRMGIGTREWYKGVRNVESRWSRG